MRILIYGAANIGCLYAAKLAKSRQDVALLARGGRYEALRNRGITLENDVSGERQATSVSVVAHLYPGDLYGLVMVVLPKTALAEVLPSLAANARASSIMFFWNDVSGPKPMTSTVGRDRVLLGFPGAAAIPQNGAIRYVITSRHEQPTRTGELDGGGSERSTAIASALGGAGFLVSICAGMDAWLKTHVAKILRNTDRWRPILRKRACRAASHEP